MTNFSNEEEKNTPIVFYVRNQNIENLKQAIKNGEDVNKKGEDFRNPLALVLALKNLEIAEILLKNGADATLLCAREPICFMAIKHSKRTINAIKYNKSAYELLKKYNINFDIKNSLNKTLEEMFDKYLKSI